MVANLSILLINGLQPNEILGVLQKDLQVDMTSTAVSLRPDIVGDIEGLQGSQRHLQLVKPVQVHHLICPFVLIPEDIENFREGC